MKKDKIYIDAHQFAFQFVDKLDLKVEDENYEAAAKKMLAAYLTAYYLTEQFNQLENEFFIDKADEKVSIYQKFLSELNQY